MRSAFRVRPSTLLLLFALVGCDDTPSGPSTPFGNLRVTVTGLPTGTAAAVTVSGPNGFNQSLTSTQTFSQVAPGDYTVSATSITVGSRVYTPSPATQTVTVLAGNGTTNASVAYSAPVGTLIVNITGLGTGSTAAVTVTGPNGYVQDVPATTTLGDLDPGDYTVTARDTVANGGTPHTASPPTQTVSVAAYATVSVTVVYSPPPADGSVNLRVAGFYLSQSAQDFAGSVPLVKDRAAYLRVFAVADRSNSAVAAVKVRFFDGLVQVDSQTVSAGLSVPTAVDESSLSYSWNFSVPGSRVQPNLRIQAEVDPAGTVLETNEGDNTYPATPLPMDVRTVPTLDVTFVPVLQLGIPAARRVRGNVSAANTAQFTSLTQKMHPVAAINSVIHADYTTTTTDTLQALNGNGAWTTILGEIDALRIAESSVRYYYGVANVSYSSGVAGVAYVSNATTGGRAALGWDKAGTAGIIASHELGHNWGRSHSPCGGPSDVDGAYPRLDGTTGNYGMDVAAQALQPPTSKDVMGYCDPKWISNYTYSGVMNYLLAPSPPLLSQTGSSVQPALLLWGYIRNGQPVLEPAFQVNARPSLPPAPGPYTISGHTADGVQLFNFSFTPKQVADGRVDQQNFAFAVPLPSARVSQLATIRLVGRGRQAVQSGTALGAAQSGTVEARRIPGGWMLRWDAQAHPMAMIRDAGTGQVLSFARGGEVTLPTTRPELQVLLSNGVRTRVQRVSQ